MTSVPTITLNNGLAMPQLGFGVFQVPEAETTAAVTAALEAGYRSIDTATIYGNERAVGAAIAASGIARDDLFVTTKLWNVDQGYDTALRAFDASLAKLGLDTLDLYLIHWPTPARDRYVDTWRAFDAAHGIATEAWSPLAKGTLLEEDALTTIAARHGKTPAQVVLRWHIQLGNIVIPKSVTPERIRQNIDVFDFELSNQDVDAITALDRGLRTGPDPDAVN